MGYHNKEGLKGRRLSLIHIWGIYGGAIGYLDFSGNLDTCIAIRLAYLKDGVITVRSGAGIVADSIPENEYQECINKAKAVIQATREAEKGLTL